MNWTFAGWVLPVRSFSHIRIQRTGKILIHFAMFVVPLKKDRQLPVSQIGFCLEYSRKHNLP